MIDTPGDGEQCPVCGWSTIRCEGIPNDPDGDRPYGVMIVHELTSQGRAGHFQAEGCEVYANGDTFAWTPEGDR